MFWFCLYFVLQKTKTKIYQIVFMSQLLNCAIFASVNAAAPSSRMKAAKVYINKRILSTLWVFALLHLSLRREKSGIPAWYQ